MVKPEPWENPMLDTMWSFMQMGGLKANYPALKEACMELRQMLMQKTAGQRKDRSKDLSWENLERVKVTIICEAMALVLSGEYEGGKQTDGNVHGNGCRGRQHDSWGTCIDLVHAIEHQQWLDSPVEKRESPGTTNRSFKPIPLGHEPFPKIERVEE